MMKKIIFFYFILLSSNSFSQNDKDNFLLERDIKKKCQEKFINFHKAHSFFFKKQKDSSFFYSSQAYNSISEESEIKSYLDYIYGVNAIHKKFFSLAQEKLKSIPTTFSYKYLVNYNLGNIALNTSQYEKALDYYTSVINSNKIQSSSRLKRIYHNIGICYLHLKNYNVSEKFLLKELKIAQNEKDTLSIIYSKLDLGNLFYVQYKDNIAISYFKEAYQLAGLFPDIKSKQTTAQNLAIVEKNRKHYKESTFYYTEYVKWKDSLWNRDRISELLEKDKQIALAIKDKEVTIQKEITKKQKERTQLFIIILIIVLLFLAILFYLFRIKVKQNILIKTQKKQLEKLNTTKNYLLSVISHDLRTPINAINVNHKKVSELLKTNDISDALILNNKSAFISENASQILNNILNWALQQNNQLLFIPELHPTRILIDAILYDFKPIADAKNISLSAIFTSSKAKVYLDKELFKIAFRNLIDNAIKYTPEEGKIEIETTSNSKKCILTIKDTGIGMSQDILSTINNYDTLTVEKIDRSKGLGLGLILSKTLIIKNSGIFKIANNIDRGITITLELPTKET